MFVTFDPEDGSPTMHFTFDPEELRRSEAIAIEKAYGQPLDVWLNALRIKEVKARAVLLWHLFKMDGKHKGLKYEDVPDFRMRQMKLEMSSDELRELYNEMARTKMDEDVRDAFESAFQRDLQDALEREGKAMEGDIEGAVVLPKAL